MKTVTTYLELVFVYFQLFKIMKKERTVQKEFVCLHRTSEKVTAAVSSDEGQKARTDPNH